MKNLLLLSLSGLCLFGCSEPATSETNSVSVSNEIVEVDASFEDVLRQHQQLNARLDHVTYRLRVANAELCSQTERSLGLTVHTVSDYPEDIQDLARATLFVSDAVSVRTVWPGSPADDAGLRKSDTITTLAGCDLPTGATSKKLFEAISTQSLNATTVDLSILRNGETIRLKVRPETLCGYESRILWVDQVNAFTNGETLLITSELLRQTDDDNDLAMFVAHEMAHAIARHIEQTPSKELELEADRMGLVLMARAGFNIESAIENWPNMKHPHFADPEKESTHPSEVDRLENFQATQIQIQAKQQAGEVLSFE